MLEAKIAIPFSTWHSDVPDAAAARPVRGHRRRKGNEASHLNLYFQTFSLFVFQNLFVVFFKTAERGTRGNGGANGEDDPVSRFGVAKTASTESRRGCRDGNTRPAHRLIFRDSRVAMQLLSWWGAC
jgi:hypothetical protein